MKLFRQIIIIVCVAGLVITVAFDALMHSIGKNFVHDKPASEEYYQNISNRIYFTTNYRGDKFDTLLNMFLRSNSQYSLPDNIDPQSIGDSNCNCDCLPLKQFVYFDHSPY